MSRNLRIPQPQGQARQSQIVNSFGPGALVDLPEHSVIVGGLETWHGQGQLVMEERLRNELRLKLGVPFLELRAPPVKDGDRGPSAGIHAYIFPQWFVAQHEENRWGGTARPLVKLTSLEKGKFYRLNAARLSVVPIRFVQACVHGHISDINWRLFVHGAEDRCGRALWLVERGTSGDLGSVSVHCECGQSRAVGEATLNMGSSPLGFCSGERPWLGNLGRERCGGPDGPAAANRFLVRHATNAWFPLTAGVIHIPDREGELRKAVEAGWDLGLKNVNSKEIVNTLRNFVPQVKAALDGFDSDIVYAEILRRNGLSTVSTKGLKELELETLLSSPDEIGEDKPQGDFYARVLPLARERTGPAALIERIVLVHRLREVQAMVGFTRFEPPAFNVDGELDLPIRPADLARELKWVPAVENRGEGILIVLKKDKVDAWAQTPAVQKRMTDLLSGFQTWQSAETSRQNSRFPGSRYMLLHSLSHLLLTAVSLECGYSASSIRERIYAIPHLGYAILLFTGSSDAEGTLGGLIQVGRKIERHLTQALELGRLCSNDPICAQHRPEAKEEDRLLHGAACHGCLLISETSCEHRNVFLDRALVVPTVDSADAAFFGEDI